MKVIKSIQFFKFRLFSYILSHRRSEIGVVWEPSWPEVTSAQAGDVATRAT